MHIYLYDYGDRYELIFSDGIKMAPDVNRVVEIGQLTRSVPACRFVVGPKDGTVFDIDTITHLLDEVAVKYTKSCIGCTHLYTDTYGNTYCQRHAPTPSPHDGTAWWPYLNLQGKPTPGCGDYS